jgi:DNA-binding transcriptional MerR regulator
MSADPRLEWRVGELAEMTGLTVRALHHYDEIGLLRPSSRSGAGHRRYAADDVRRLHRILALRGFGLSLAEIGEVLAGTETDPRDLIRRQLNQVEERIMVARQLCHSLLDVLRALDNAVEPSAQTLIELIEVMTAMERPLSPEQLHATSESRHTMRQSLSEEQLASMAQDRERAMAQIPPDELAEMHRKRAALLPIDRGTPGSS